MKQCGKHLIVALTMSERDHVAPPIAVTLELNAGQGFALDNSDLHSSRRLNGGNEIGLGHTSPAVSALPLSIRNRANARSSARISPDVASGVG